MKHQDRPHTTSNGEIFEAVPGAMLERIWWTVGAEDRIQNAVPPALDCLPYLEAAFRAGWRAMEERLEGRGGAKISPLKSTR